MIWILYLMIYSVMTREEFIEVLKRNGYSYEIVRDKVVVTDRGDVRLGALTSLPPGVVFKNGGYVNLSSLTSISPDVVFKNEGDVYLGSLTGDWFDDWKGNIEGIDSERLLNSMINEGVFER